MRERPIIFNAHSVRAILAGRKTQTRRIVTWPRTSSSDGVKRRIFTENDIAEMNELLSERRRYPLMRGFCPYGQPGDRMWVRETWQSLGIHEHLKPSEIPPGSEVQYPATNDRWVSKHRPSIHMPRWASRITLEVTGVRIERLQDISEDDAHAEGVTHAENGGMTAREGFRNLWESINGPGSWDTHPWVWAVEFRLASYL